ncbi:scaffolding protein [Paenibacillus sp. sgz5001063]|uniref:phage scaffolding protein n=1 Tax=Paenibacillus sp. sgz5001063 TaxID=3242474 RepID=UPI0036D2E99D
METEFTRSKVSRYPLNLQLFAEGDPDPDPTPDPTDKTFTQADLDRIVADRLARDRKGREDYDDIKAKLAEVEGKQATIAAEKEAAEKRAQEAEEVRSKVFEEANARLVKAEFKALAHSGELKIRADAVDDAFRLADMSAVTVDDAGNVVGIEDVIKVLIESKPYLADTAGGRSRQIGGDTNGGSRKPGTDGLSTREKLSAGYAAGK